MNKARVAFAVLVNESDADSTEALLKIAETVSPLEGAVEEKLGKFPFLDLVGLGCLRYWLPARRSQRRRRCFLQ